MASSQEVDSLAGAIDLVARHESDFPYPGMLGGFLRFPEPWKSNNSLFS